MCVLQPSKQISFHLLVKGLSRTTCIYIVDLFVYSLPVPFLNAPLNLTPIIMALTAVIWICLIRLGDKLNQAKCD